MRRTARELAHHLDDIRRSVFEMGLVLQGLDSADLPTAVRLQLGRLIHSSAAFVRETAQARDYALIVGWSRRTMGVSLGFDKAIVDALVRRSSDAPVQIAALALGLDHLYDSAIWESRSVSNSPQEQFAAVQLAREVYRTKSYLQFSPLEATFRSAADVLDALITRIELELTFHDNRPSRFARRLIAFSVSMLPPEHQERYMEEFRGEAGTMARTDQHIYAFNVLWRCFALRNSLEEEHR